jgi:hypothetical protein
MSHQQSAVSVVRTQLQAVHHGWLEGTMKDVTAEQAHWQPPGRSAPIGAQYAHAVLAEDFLLLATAGGRPPVLMAQFAGNAGISEPYPQGDWHDWSLRVKVDLDQLRKYAQAVYAAVDEYVGSLGDEDLATPVDMTEQGLGTQTIGSLLDLLVIHGAAHTGEIAVTKGLQGLQGYPF